jgi:hypothetical protein
LPLTSTLKIKLPPPSVAQRKFFGATNQATMQAAHLWDVVVRLVKVSVDPAVGDESDWHVLSAQDTVSRLLPITANPVDVENV